MVTHDDVGPAVVADDPMRIAMIPDDWGCAMIPDSDAARMPATTIIGMHRREMGWT